MTNEFDADQGPVFANQPAPEHGPNFWTDLSSAMSDGETAKISYEQTAEMGAIGATNASDETTQLAATRVAPGSPNRRQAPVVEMSPRRPAPSARRAWPLAAAAAVVALVGLGAFVMAGRDQGVSTEVVDSPIGEASVVPLDGVEGEDQDDPDAVEPATSDDQSQNSGDVSAGTDSDITDSTDTDAPATSSTDPTPIVASVEYEFAAGSTGTPILPLDGGVPADAVFLSTWEERALSWYAASDFTTDCTDARYTDIRYVNDSRITQPIRDPQLYFSGDVSHFTVQTAASRAAWLVSCGNQLEVFTGALDDQGQLLDANLVWIGEGTAASALMLLGGQGEISFNALTLDGKPLSFDYGANTDELRLVGSAASSLFEDDEPISHSATPVAASPDGTLTYWTGDAPAGEAGACGGPLDSQSTIADALWLRTSSGPGQGQWSEAITELPIGQVTAMAIDSEFSQVAVADYCDTNAGRVLIGTQRADGQISNVREIDLTPYVPGFAEQLHWIDGQTLRIETNNEEYGVAPVRFDYRFDDGRDQGVIVRLD